MKKALGAAAILSGCFFAALNRIRARRARIALLLSLRDSLNNLLRDLSERKRGMREILSSLADRYAGQAAGSFYERLADDLCELGERSFSQIWDGALHEVFNAQGETFFETLSPIGQSLGGSELEPQYAVLRNAARQLEGLAEAEREALPGERRLSYGLSLCLGAMLVIMLL